MTNWAFWLLVVLVAIMVMSGRPVESQPIVTGAAMLLTIPLNLVNALAATSVGFVILPLLFLGIVYYFRTIERYLGRDLLYFIVFAALLLAFVAPAR